VKVRLLCVTWQTTIKLWCPNFAIWRGQKRGANLSISVSSILRPLPPVYVYYKLFGSGALFYREWNGQIHPTANSITSGIAYWNLMAKKYCCCAYSENQFEGKKCCCYAYWNYIFTMPVQLKMWRWDIAVCVNANKNMNNIDLHCGKLETWIT